MKATVKLEKKIAKCKDVYLIVQYARWAIREFKWTGKFVTMYGEPCPQVWYFTDHNGAGEEYYMYPIYETTTGLPLTYTFDEKAAHRIVEALNKELCGDMGE